MKLFTIQKFVKNTDGINCFSGILCHSFYFRFSVATEDSKVKEIKAPNLSLIQDGGFIGGPSGRFGLSRLSGLFGLSRLFRLRALDLYP